MSDSFTCYAGEKFKPGSPCPKCGAGLGQECGRATQVMSNEIVTLRSQVTALREALKDLDAAFCSENRTQAERFASRKALIRARALYEETNPEAQP